MALIRIVTEIAAPIEQCFDLARDIDFHTRSLEGTGERAVAGRTTGLIELGESVTWEARHLGSPPAVHGQGDSVRPSEATSATR